jgi:hypothetical protein
MLAHERGVQESERPSPRLIWKQPDAVSARAKGLQINARPATLPLAPSSHYHSSRSSRNMSPIWRKRVPKSQSLTSALSNPTNPAPSEPIAGGTDLVISAIDPTLSALKELSSLAKSIPYISPAADLILQALKMWDVSALSDLKRILC